MNEEQEQFLQAIRDLQSQPEAWVTVEDIARRMGLDLSVKADRDRYEDVMVSLRDSGHVECQGYNYFKPCAYVRPT